ncbi:hypothetical protein ANI02nite_30220 [Acetobacter nitrogenifigens DSM 23921 = NBRC 105050]|uniref:Uncharacterized protein n=1 Tax=Acetobacter nitrogenifigens DSM 23921 = NBRC 105050 TaxID=1120919 RepID=A0A511XDV7_9PROT|nr:hypothetical protein ANI02nite_30220 [Acetobacter nitrogenifigens DSM 23921 = NBRC 105050]
MRRWGQFDLDHIAVFGDHESGVQNAVAETPLGGEGVADRQQTVPVRAMAELNQNTAGAVIQNGVMAENFSHAGLDRDGAVRLLQPVYCDRSDGRGLDHGAAK